MTVFASTTASAFRRLAWSTPAIADELKPAPGATAEPSTP